MRFIAGMSAKVVAPAISLMVKWREDIFVFPVLVFVLFSLYTGNKKNPLFAIKKCEKITFFEKRPL